MSYEIVTDSGTHNEWGIVHYIRSEGEEVRILRLRINDVPESTGKKQIKLALERAGRVFGEGDYLWGNHNILPQDEWLDLDQTVSETIIYTALLDEGKGEKRVTVRFPIGLHNALVKAARGKSFNQFCVDVMATAVGYEREPLAPALPRLAQQMGVSEGEMAGRVQRMGEGSQPTLSSPFTQKMGGHFANITGLPTDQQKQQTVAFWSNPQNVQDYQNAIQATAHFSEEQLVEMGESLGLSVEEVRQRLEKLSALPADYVEQGLKELKETSSEQIKDINLLLRYVFTENILVTKPTDKA